MLDRGLLAVGHCTVPPRTPSNVLLDRVLAVPRRRQIVCKVTIIIKSMVLVFVNFVFPNQVEEYPSFGHQIITF